MKLNVKQKQGRKYETENASFELSGRENVRKK